jgi:lipoprotein-releasing system ATP-binding protein
MEGSKEAAGELILSLEHVRKDLALSKELTQTIIPDLSLRVTRGEFVTITGPSGSGKSTLLYLMGGLDHPTGGRIVFDGHELSAMREDQLVGIRNRKIGFVYQFHHLLPEFTALENVTMPMLVAGMGKREARARGEELLERVGMKEKLKSRPNQLSGGQQQRVAVARALANRPLLLLGDEPTGSLDSVATSQVFDLMAELNAEGQTIIYVTHDKDLAARARRRINLVDGRIESDVVQGELAEAGGEAVAPHDIADTDA